jgi:hypothetical protein
MAENSKRSAKKQRGPGRPFPKGKSPNPGGRPKVAAELRELAREHTERALQVIVAALDDDDARVRIAAAKELLDRGYGKPSQEVVATGGSVVLGFANLSDEELERQAKAILDREAS